MKKILGVSAMIKNTNALKALAAVKDSGMEVVLATTTKKGDAEAIQVVTQNLADADVVIVGLGSDNSPWQIEVQAAERAIVLGKPLVLLTDWPGTIRGRTEGRLSAEVLSKVVLAIVPKGDGELVCEVCPSAQVLETHHPDVEGAEIIVLTKSDLHRELGIADGNYVVIITGGKTREVNKEVLFLVKKAGLSDVAFLFLVHPGEQDTPIVVYEEYGARVIPAGTVVQGKKANSDFLLPLADAFFNIASTSADRAGFLRIPVLWAQTPLVRAILKKNSGSEVPPECTGDEPVAVPIATAAELVFAIQKLKGDISFVAELKRRQEMYYPVPTPEKGTAAKAMANAVLQICS